MALLLPPATRRHVRYKTTKILKESACRQLEKFRGKILDEQKHDPLFWNVRVKNLMGDIDDLNWDVDDLLESEIWPADYTDRFKDVYETCHRLGIDVGLLNSE